MSSSYFGYYDEKDFGMECVNFPSPKTPTLEEQALEEGFVTARQHLERQRSGMKRSRSKIWCDEGDVAHTVAVKADRTRINNLISQARSLMMIATETQEELERTMNGIAELMNSL
jgi:hypothetical protein